MSLFEGGEWRHPRKASIKEGECQERVKDSHSRASEGFGGPHPGHGDRGGREGHVCQHANAQGIRRKRDKGCPQKNFLYNFLGEASPKQ